MLLGFSNAPLTFQVVMNDLFRPMFCKYVKVFLMTSSFTIAVGKTTYNIFLDLLHCHKFYATRKKCSFGQPIVDYLGHTKSHQGVAM